MVEEEHAKLPLEAVGDKTPQLLITAEAMREDDQRTIRITNDLDVVSCVDVHGSSLSRQSDGQANMTGRGPRLARSVGCTLRRHE